MPDTKIVASSPTFARITAARQSEVPQAGTFDLVSQLQRLAELKASGILTEEEFSAAKAKLLRDQA